MCQLLQVCMDQNCHANVFLLSCNIMDRFLSQLGIKKSQFQVSEKKREEKMILFIFNPR